MSRRPRLADWGEYAAAVYEVMGWGAEIFLKDWDEVVRVQNRATLDGSPVAQAIIKLMEEHEECSDTSSKMHALLKEIAEAQGVDVARDKAWPKSARWLWRRIKEVLPLLVAAGIEADRTEDRSGTKISLRKMTMNDASNTTEGGNPTDKGKARGNTNGNDATANATAASNATQNPADRAESGNSGNSGIRSGDFSRPVSFDAESGENVTVAELRARRAEIPRSADVRQFLSRPPNWLQKQMAHCRAQGCPTNQLGALAASVAADLCGDAMRGTEILPEIEAFMTHGVGCGCEECR